MTSAFDLMCAEIARATRQEADEARSNDFDTILYRNQQTMWNGLVSDLWAVARRYAEASATRITDCNEIRIDEDDRNTLVFIESDYDVPDRVEFSVDLVFDTDQEQTLASIKQRREDQNRKINEIQAAATKENRRKQYEELRKEFGDA
jgi:hypothetical protein